VCGERDGCVGGAQLQSRKESRLRAGGRAHELARQASPASAARECEWSLPEVASRSDVRLPTALGNVLHVAPIIVTSNEIISNIWWNGYVVAGCRFHSSLLPPKHRLEPLHLPLVLLHLLLTDHHLVQQVLRPTRHLRRPPLQLAEQKQFRLALVDCRALKLGQVTQDRKIQSALEYLVFGQPVPN
jgi:hypothetical protein